MRHVSHSQFPHPHHSWFALLPVKCHVDVVSLARLEGVSRLHCEGRVVDAKLELGKLREDVLERDVEGVARFDDKGSLRFWRKAMANEWYGIFSCCVGGDGEDSLSVSQMSGFKGHFEAGLSVSSRCDGLLHTEITAVDLTVLQQKITSMHNYVYT